MEVMGREGGWIKNKKNNKSFCVGYNIIFQLHTFHLL